MLRTIGLNHQLLRNAEKVDNERADRDLTPELEPLQAAVAKDVPKPTFRLGKIGAHCARTLYTCRRVAVTH